MLKKVGSVLALSISLTISFSATAQTENSDVLSGFSYLGSISPKINDVMNTCSARLWPGYDWKNRNVISYEGPGRALIWRGETGQVSQISDELVMPLVRGSVYNFAEFEGKRSVIINMTNPQAIKMTPYQILDLVLHEGFHYFGQEKWVRSYSQRGTSYPLESQPRLFRKMLFLRLKDHLISNGEDQAALHKAAFWFRIWKQFSPEEFNGSTDGYEGTAKYVGSLGTILAGQGCNVDEASFFKAAQSYAERSMGQSVQGNRIALDAEGYDIGGISSIILRFMSKNTQWYKEVEAGKTPTQILLEGVTVLREDLLPGDLEKFEQTAQTNNKAYLEMMGSVLNDLKDKNFIRVVPTSASSSGSYSPMAFILPKQFPGLSVVPMQTERVFAARGGHVKSSFGAVFLNGWFMPCENGYQWLEVPSTAIQSSAAGFKIDHPFVQGEASGKLVTDAYGKKWLCLFE